MAVSPAKSQQQDRAFGMMDGGRVFKKGRRGGKRVGLRAANTDSPQPALLANGRQMTCIKPNKSPLFGLA
jgi:hypothetical protein